jgi:tetratricopeptide (TPR) repeat protein
MYHYRCFRDYERALAEIQSAEAIRPNDTEILELKGILFKRQGQFRQALRLNERVSELDPLNLRALREIAHIHSFLREYPKSHQAFQRAIAIRPAVAGLYWSLADMQLRWTGSSADAQAVLDTMPATSDPRSDLTRIRVEYYAGRYENALARTERLPEMVEDQEKLTPRAWYAALCYEGLGQASRARASWESAVAFLEAKVRESPEDFRAHSGLGPALAALGREQEALAAARRAVALMPPSKDAQAATTPATNLALTLVRLGRLDAAFERVEEILAKPGRLSIPFMRLDPAWRPLVEDPRFAELEERFGNSSTPGS